MATTKPPAQTVLPDEEFNKKWDQENLYQNVKRTNDPRFGEITVVKNSSTNEILFVKEKMASSKNEASNDIRELKSRIALNHPNLQKVVNYSTAVKKELCSTHYLSRGFYEFPRSDTQKENLERKRNLTGFSSSELTHLAYQALSGLNHLHSKNITHGDIRPLNIGYNKASNQFQILDRLSDPSPLEKLQAANIINKKELYVAPELWKKLQGKDKTLKYNAYKNDLYALGLSILTLGTSDSVQDIYKPNGEFDQNRLNEHISAFNNKYQAENPYLCTIVKKLLAPTEADRPDSQQFISNLIPYEEYKQQEVQGIKPQGGANVHSQPADEKQYVFNQGIAQDTGHNVQSDFFTYQNNAPVQTQSQPQTEKIIINKAEHDGYQSSPDQYKYQGNYSNLNTTNENTVSYSYAQPTTTYTYAQAPTYTQTPTYTQAPTYTYQNQEVKYADPSNVSYLTNNTGNVTTYSYTQPATNYVQSTPTYSYTQAPTTYVQGEPITYTQPTTTYVNAEPITYIQPTTTTYVQSDPISYTQGTPTYTYAQPSNVYYQNDSSYSYVKPNATFVNAGIEGTRVERKSYTYAAPVERKSYTQYVTGIDGVKTVRKSYTQYVSRPEVTTTTEFITQKAPVSYVYSQPTTTYGAPVERIIERRSYTTQATPTTTYVQSLPTTYVYSQPSTVYANYVPYNEKKVEGGYQETTDHQEARQAEPSRTYYVNEPSKVYSTPYEGKRVIYQSNVDNQYTQYAQPEGHKIYSYASPTNYVQGEPSRNMDNNVEIRRGSFAPTQSETKVIKKKYIIEGDVVKEVDANEYDQHTH